MQNSHTSEGKNEKRCVSIQLILCGDPLKNVYRFIESERARGFKLNKRDAVLRILAGEGSGK